jgi:hypothetical protein
VKPFIFIYANDNLMPYRLSGPNIEQNLDHLGGVAMPIDTGGVGAGSFEELKEKLEEKARIESRKLDGKELKAAWIHHYRAAEHGDMQFHPERTVKAVLQVLEQ